MCQEIMYQEDYKNRLEIIARLYTPLGVVSRNALVGLDNAKNLEEYMEYYDKVARIMGIEIRKGLNNLYPKEGSYE